jgi:diguanylate cyclase (GGDEF)-like protein/PAS domain S-box-containing protein
MDDGWTRERLLAFVEDREVHVKDRNAVSRPVPDWLLATGATAPVVSTGQRLGLIHPDDRQTAIDNWWHAVNNPGELVEYEARVHLDGAWVLSHVRKVCLYDDPVIDGVVEATRYGRRMAAHDFEEVVQSGEFEDARWLIHTVDENGIILSSEGMIEEITGRAPTDMVGHSPIEHIHPDGFDDALTVWMEIQNGPPGTTRTSRHRVVHPDGTIVWVESTTIKRVGEDGRGKATLIVLDLSDRRRREAALRASHQEFRLLADQVPAAVFRADATGRVTFRNERWTTEIDGDDPVDTLAGLVHPDDRERHRDELDRLAGGRHDATAAYEVRCRDGARVLAVTCRSVQDLVNDERSYVGSVTDITATVRLRERAERDALTGAYNRHATEEHLARTLAGDAAGTLVAFVDLDGFKDVNDTYGHDAGDAVLRELVRRFAAGVRPDDVVGRYGGDEFIIVVSGATERGRQILVDRLDIALAEPVTWPGGSWSPAASIGLARGRDGERVEDLVRRADQEMFTVKRRRKSLA